MTDSSAHDTFFCHVLRSEESHTTESTKDSNNTESKRCFATAQHDANNYCEQSEAIQSNLDCHEVVPTSRNDEIANNADSRNNNSPSLAEGVRGWVESKPKTTTNQMDWVESTIDSNNIESKVESKRCFATAQHDANNHCNEGDIILDFFAGSGTTAHSVMQLNSEDNGNRKFILVQLDEPILDSKSKVTYEFCKNELKSENPAISDITIERVKRAGEKIKAQNPNVDTGFCVYSLCEKLKLISDEKGSLKLQTKSEITPQDLARNLALNSGKTLDTKLIEIIASKLYLCEDSLYITNCDKEVLEYLKIPSGKQVFISGYEEINLEIFLNLESSLKERLNVVY